MFGVYDLENTGFLEDPGGESVREFAVDGGIAITR